MRILTRVDKLKKMTAYVVVIGISQTFATYAREWSELCKVDKKRLTCIRRSVRGQVEQLIENLTLPNKGCNKESWRWVHMN